MTNDDTIRISDILHVVIKRRMLLILLAVCGLVIGIVMSVFNYMRGEMSRTYAITSAIAVTSQTQDGLYTSKERTPNSSDISLAENMADSVVYVLKSDKTLNAAIRHLSLVGISITDVYNNLTVSKVGTTQIIELKLYWRNAEEGVEILNAINQVAPAVLGEVLQIGNVSVVNNPKSQYRIGGSVNAMLWVLMVMGGLMLGIGLCVLEVLFFPKLIEPEDLSTKLDLELLGKIPEHRKLSDAASILSELDEDVHWNEHFVSAARLLNHKLRDQQNHCLLVTSSTIDEGKSNIAARLGYCLSEQEHRVLLVDLDLHDPKLAVLFHEHPDYYHSLNGMYRGDCSHVEAIHHLTPSLDLLPTVVEPNSSIPLNSELIGMLRALSADYDYVLIVTSPAGLSSDIAALQPLTDQVLFIARCDHTLFSAITETRTWLSDAGFTVVGCLSNGSRDKAGKTEQAFFKGKKRAVARKPARVTLAEDGKAAESSTNRVVHSAGLEHQGLIDDSLARSFEEVRS